MLGPPTVDQDQRVAKQRENNPEYWLGAGRLAARGGSGGRGRAEAGARPCRARPGRWLVDGCADQRSHSRPGWCATLDDALNNTSVILLLEVGGRRMLFPGDAQIENWQYTLERLTHDPKLRDRLARVDLYKVGHHGSRNATPRSLHALWRGRSPDHPRMTALLSTRQDVHGERDTAVPQEQLLTALRAVADVYSTDEPVTGAEFVEVVADAKGGPFHLVPPPN